MNSKNLIYLNVLLAALLTVGLTGCASQHTNQQSMPDMPGMNHEMAKSNRISAEYNWKLIQPSQPYQAGKPITLSWVIKEKETGTPVRNFELIHTKKAHLVIVSRDLSVFQHVHPDVIGPGKMSVDHVLPKEGQYMIYLQFAPTGKEEVTLDQPLQIGQVQTPTAQLVPDADQPKVIDGYTFRMESLPSQTNVSSMPKLVVEKDGKPVENIAPYLGAGGHAVIISEDTQSFLHVHPMSGAKNGFYHAPLVFHTLIPQPGRYKLWVQLKIGDKLETVDFTFQVQ